VRSGCFHALAQLCVGPHAANSARLRGWCTARGLTPRIGRTMWVCVAGEQAPPTTPAGGAAAAAAVEGEPPPLASKAAALAVAESAMVGGAARTPTDESQQVAEGGGGGESSSDASCEAGTAELEARCRAAELRQQEAEVAAAVSREAVAALGARLDAAEAAARAREQTHELELHRLAALAQDLQDSDDTASPRRIPSPALAAAMGSAQAEPPQQHGPTYTAALLPEGQCQQLVLQLESQMEQKAALQTELQQRVAQLSEALVQARSEVQRQRNLAQSTAQALAEAEAVAKAEASHARTRDAALAALQSMPPLQAGGGSRLLDEQQHQHTQLEEDESQTAEAARADRANAVASAAGRSQAAAGMADAAVVVLAENKLRDKVAWVRWGTEVDGCDDESLDKAMEEAAARPVSETHAAPVHGAPAGAGDGYVTPSELASERAARQRLSQQLEAQAEQLRVQASAMSVAQTELESERAAQ
jgi:hypothetical protein